MADELTDRAVLVQRGEEARMILSSKLFEEAIDNLRAAYTEALLKVPNTDDLGRFRYVEALRQVATVRRHLETVLTSGEIAQSEIVEMNAKDGLIARLVRTF